MLVCWCYHVIPVPESELWCNLFLRIALDKHKYLIKSKVVTSMMSIFRCTVDLNHCACVNTSNVRLTRLYVTFKMYLMGYGKHIRLVTNVLAITLETKSRADCWSQICDVYITWKCSKTLKCAKSSMNLFCKVWQAFRWTSSIC